MKIRNDSYELPYRFYMKTLFFFLNGNKCHKLYLKPDFLMV